MKIAIARQALLLQIDLQSKAGDLPEKLYLEGVQVLADDEKDALEKAMPEMRKAFTYTQYRIMRELFQNKGRIVRSAALFTIVTAGSTRSTYETSNTIAVHIKSIRRKINEQTLPFKIRTHRGGSGWGGGLRHLGGYSLEVLA